MNLLYRFGDVKWQKIQITRFIFMFLQINSARKRLNPTCAHVLYCVWICTSILHPRHTGRVITHIRVNNTVHKATVLHYNDVIMSAMASQITSITTVYSTVYSQRKYQSSTSLAFVWGNSPVTGEFPAQMASNAIIFPFDDVIMVCRWCGW